MRCAFLLNAGLDRLPTLSESALCVPRASRVGLAAMFALGAHLGRGRLATVEPVRRVPLEPCGLSIATMPGPGWPGVSSAVFIGTLYLGTIWRIFIHLCHRRMGRHASARIVSLGRTGRRSRIAPTVPLGLLAATMPHNAPRAMMVTTRTSTLTMFWFVFRRLLARMSRVLVTLSSSAILVHIVPALRHRARNVPLEPMPTNLVRGSVRVAPTGSMRIVLGLKAVRRVRLTAFRPFPAMIASRIALVVRVGRLFFPVSHRQGARPAYLVHGALIVGDTRRASCAAREHMLRLRT